MPRGRIAEGTAPRRLVRSLIVIVPHPRIPRQAMFGIWTRSVHQKFRIAAAHHAPLIKSRADDDLVVPIF